MKCRICGNHSKNKPYVFKEMMFGYQDEFNYFQCSRCDCLQIRDFPSNMDKYYPDQYYAYQSDFQHRNKFKQFLMDARNRYAVSGKDLLGRILYKKYPTVSPSFRSLALLKLNKQCKILDVGCGAGELLYGLNKMGFSHLLGADPFNQTDIEYPNGLKILKQEIADIRGLWDVIMFHHSLEHIVDQVGTLHHVARLLSSKGTCIIRIPLVSSYAWQHYKENWVQLDAPRHYFLHSMKSIQILCDATNLILDCVIYDSDAFQFWGSEQYIHHIPLFSQMSYNISKNKSRFSKGEIATFLRKAQQLNASQQGDQAVFYLKKVV